MLKYKPIQIYFTLRYQIRLFFYTLNNDTSETFLKEAKKLLNEYLE